MSESPASEPASPEPASPSAEVANEPSPEAPASESAGAPEAPAAEPESPAQTASARGSSTAQRPSRAPGAHVPFALRRWVAVHQRGILLTYGLTLVLLNLAVLGWYYNAHELGLERRLQRAGQERWLSRYEALRPQLSAAPPEERVALCQAFLADAPQAQLREILGRARLDVGLRLAEAQLELGDPREAELVAAELARTDPEDFRLPRLLGDAQWAQGDQAAAIASYHSALVLRAYLPRVAGRVATGQLAAGDPAAAWATYLAYRDATWIEEAGLALRMPGGTLRGPIRVPVLVDARPHTYRLQLDGGRQLSRLARPSPLGVAGLLLSASREATPRISFDRLQIELPQRGPSAQRGPPLLDVQDFKAWAPATISVGDAPWIERALQLPSPHTWGEIRLTLTLSRPFPPELLSAARQASRALGLPLPAELSRPRKP